jgi:hypothetical protein
MVWREIVYHLFYTYVHIFVFNKCARYKWLIKTTFTSCKKKESLSPSWIQKLAELFYASESYVAARLAFRSVGFFYVAQPSSYDVERTSAYH